MVKTLLLVLLEIQATYANLAGIVPEPVRVDADTQCLRDNWHFEEVLVGMFTFALPVLQKKLDFAHK